MKSVVVTVSGRYGSGKSAVALIIEKALKEHGINASLIDDNGVGIVDEAPGVVESTLPARLTSLTKDNLTVVVQTRTSRHAG